MALSCALRISNKTRKEGREIGKERHICGVVVVDPEVAFAFHGEGHAAVLCEGGVHVVEEADACADIDDLLYARAWCAVEVDVDLDVCFISFAGEGSFS